MKEVKHKKDIASPVVTDITSELYDTQKQSRVILFNCYCHTFEEVVLTIMRAIHCTEDEGYELANEADREGQAIICTGSELYCRSVVGIFRSVGLNAEVAQ